MSPEQKEVEFEKPFEKPAEPSKPNDVSAKPNEEEAETEGDGRSHDLNSMIFHSELESVEDELMNFIEQSKQDQADFSNHVVAPENQTQNESKPNNLQG